MRKDERRKRRRYGILRQVPAKKPTHLLKSEKYIYVIIIFFLSFVLLFLRFAELNEYSLFFDIHHR